MKRILVAELFLIQLFVLSSAGEKTCFEDAASILGEYDSLLAGRITFKDVYLNMPRMNEERFFELMENFTSNGTSYTTRGTSDWLSEIFQGLGNQYEELMQLKKKLSAGYTAISNSKDELFQYFDKYESDDNSYFFKMRIEGAFPRQWIIEKLSYRRGYRIYQSGDDAFSLKAWLTTKYNMFDFKTQSFWRNRYLMVWEANKKRIEQRLKETGRSLDDMDAINEQIRPWMRYVRDYNRDEARKNFEKSWNAFGAKRILSQKQFQEEYLGLLHNVTSQMQPYFKDNTLLWTQEIFNSWIGLFGTPNHYCYPDVPFNAAEANTLPNFLRLKIKVVSNPGETWTAENARILAKSVKHSTNDIGLCSKGENIKQNFWLLSAVSFITMLYYLTMV
ncbi:uncharacterized protein [Clytia hemisphaerica]|uniref:uncharacterized protein n=1 Tax=Clytia hemisphaerica TaxID=252671 RepID=UPI0034D5DC10|eukprot:TCONS_00047407-protein